MTFPRVLTVLCAARNDYDALVFGKLAHSNFQFQFAADG